MVREREYTKSPVQQETVDFRPTLNPQEWASMNTFFARIISACNPGHNHFDIVSIESIQYFLPWYSRATVILTDAFEFPNTAEQMNSILPAAASWIIYNGLLWRRTALENQFQCSPQRSGLVLMGGPLYGGPGPVTETRWNFWKRRLAKFSENSDLTKNCKDWARRAYDSMVEIEAEIPAATATEIPSFNRTL
jgi:hypothetical protein